jgi:TonB family protein
VEAVWTASNGLVLASIEYDSAGARDHVDLLAARLAPLDAARLRTALEANVAPEAQPDAQVHIVLADEAGPTVRRVARFQGCAPTFANRGWLAEQLRTRGATLGLRRPHLVRLATQVLPDGTAGEIRIAESSGDPQVDEAAAAIFRDAVFRPALVEGIPVTTWAVFPIAFTPVERRQRGPGGRGTGAAAEARQLTHGRPSP